MARLLDDMGRPQAKLKAIHVAGTKGKGSVAAMLSSILHSSGYKTGTYTSPHIVHLRERIAVGMEPIPEGTFEGLVRGNEAVLLEANRREQGRLSHFEALTALAICHFAQQQAGGLSYSAFSVAS
jgi:folylpolyglutamate synthase/dihydropteroate synthase